MFAAYQQKKKNIKSKLQHVHMYRACNYWTAFEIAMAEVTIENQAFESYSISVSKDLSKFVEDKDYK